MKKFFQEAGNGNGHNADGLIYSIKFVNHPTGTTDDDFYLGSDTSKNYCAQPYGNAYILVNKADVAPGERAWDPWWDDKLIKKTVRHYTNSKKTATSSDVAHIPIIYCHYPSPGDLEWDEDQKKWVNETKRGLLKDDTMMTRDVDVDVDVDVDIDIDKYNDTLDIMSEEKVKDFEVPTLAFPRPRYSRTLMPLAGRGGSFLDPSAFLYLGCGQSEDIGPCADNDDCYVDTINDGGVGDDGSWGPDVPGGNGGNGGGDDGGDDDGEPSGFDWGIRWSANECKQKDTSVTTDQASKCSRVDVSSPNFQVTSAQGFTKPGYKACFYSSNDCTAKSDKDFASMSGGDRLKDDSECVTLGSGQGIASYEVVKDNECIGYMRVLIDSCDCSAKANKQGGWVENNCIMTKIDANSGA
ncbi:hypothetical protein BKA56DRAFT_665840 [Ilyonectria sp. MPI-CAGE-AT-0026]|nr:hypothetical protein BKA56DRAFT_665840 [Ilyonectria sp. MPI-CAGE-AT-0026]